jgi:hypothetical protein
MPESNVIRMPEKKKRFSDFAKETFALDGDKVSIEQILNREIEITGYKITGSKFKKDGRDQCLTLQFQMDGKKFVAFTGSQVLISQVERYSSEIPFSTTITKQFKYFTMT